MKKTIKIDGKEYELKAVEEVVTEEPTVAVPAKEEVVVEEPVKEEVAEETVVEEAPVVDDVDAKIEEATTKVMANLGLDKIMDKLADLETKTVANSTEAKQAAGLLDLEVLMQKDVKSMTVTEKITGFFQAMMQSNHSVLKALSEGTSADGGYLFPDEFRAEVIRDISDGHYMRQHVTVVPMKRDVMKIPTLESRPIVTWTEENTTKSTTTAHFGEATLTVKKLAAILYASDELIEDSTEVDVVRFIIGLFSEVIGEEEDRVIWRGNGTTQPTGVVTARAAGAIASVTCSGNLSIDNLITLIYTLPAKYHKGAKLFVHRNNISEMRKLKDSNNRHYWQEPVAIGQPSTFYGYPVIETNDIGEDQIYFGDLKKTYWLGDRKKMTVKISQDTETAFTKDQTAIRVVHRVAGNVVLGNGTKALISIP